MALTAAETSWAWLGCGGERLRLGRLSQAQGGGERKLLIGFRGHGDGYEQRELMVGALAGIEL